MVSIMVGFASAHPVLSLVRHHDPLLWAGALAAGVSCPADVVLVRMQGDGRLPAHMRRNYRNVFHGLASIVRDEGPRR